LQYNRTRYYNATFGRFISEDPFDVAGGSANLYQYAGDSPTVLTDPLGLTPSFVFWAEFAGGVVGLCLGIGLAVWAIPLLSGVVLSPLLVVAGEATLTAFGTGIGGIMAGATPWQAARAGAIAGAGTFIGGSYDWWIRVFFR
jgi:uncharacterized protein RhaS with RHS repeats